LQIKKISELKDGKIRSQEELIQSLQWQNQELRDKFELDNSALVISLKQEVEEREKFIENLTKEFDETQKQTASKFRAKKQELKEALESKEKLKLEFKKLLFQLQEKKLVKVVDKKSGGSNNTSRGFNYQFESFLGEESQNISDLLCDSEVDRRPSLKKLDENNISLSSIGSARQ